MAWTFSGFADEAGGQIDEQIEALQAAGMNHIDLRNVEGQSITELPADAAQEIARKLENAGLRVAMFGSPIGKIDVSEDFATDLQRLKHLAQLADVFECRKIRIFSYYNRNGLDEPAWEKETLRRLNQLIELADRHDLTLFHENEKHIFGEMLERVERLASLRQGERFKLIFDFDNYNQAGEDCWANWRALCDKTDAFHLKDSTSPPEPMHVPIGQGGGKAREILTDALSRGWEGPLSLEPHLAHSDAVLATGPSGKPNEKLADASPRECFLFAAAEAKKLLDKIGAAYT